MPENEEIVTKQCIIEEYLSNWFTYEELAAYLAVDLDYVTDVLDNYTKYDHELRLKVATHTLHIRRYYDHLNEEELIDETLPSIKIARYMIANKSSIRKTADALGYGKSFVQERIHEYLPSDSIKLYKEVFEIIMANKSSSTDSQQIRRQVLESFMYLKMGHSIDEIKDLQHLSWSAVQRNLTKRLKKIDEKKYREAKAILEANQHAPLEEHKFKPHGK